jgi:tetratricopeptide (TPR) repeat protein
VPSVHAGSTRSASVALVALLACGTALARGGVDLPVLALAALLAVAALFLAAGRRRREPPALSALVVGLAAALAAIAAQLVPLPPALLGLLSPAARETFADVLAPVGLWPSWRPLSLDPGATALELSRAATLLAVAASGALLAESERRRDALLRAVALSGAVVVAVHYGAALLGLSPLLAPKVAFVNTNHLAGFFLVTAWPALGFALRARGPARAGWLAAFAFTSSGVFLSLSRAGIAAWFLAAGTFAVLRLRASAPAAAAVRPARARGRTVAAAGLAAALAVAAWLAFDPVVAELATVSDGSTTDLKLGLWPAAASVLRDFPLAGIGRGAFATVYPAYKSEPAQATFAYVENEWLQLPVDLGLAGVGVVALFAWAFLAAARRRDLSSPLAAALAGAGAVAAQNLFDFGLEVPGVAIPFALVLGVASRAMPRVEVRAAGVRAGAALLLLVAGAGLALHRAHPLDAAVAAVAGAGTADEAALRARDALRWHPADWAPHAAAGAKLAAADRCAEALPWLTRAMLRNPTAPEPHRSAAACLAHAGQDAHARREYRLAFLYGDEGALAEAFARYDAPGALLEIAPDTPEGLLAAGELLRARPAEAAEAWRRGWETFGDLRALAQLAQARLALGEADEALRLARLLVERAPRAAAGYVVASRALDALGRGGDALRELERGAARLPGDAALLGPLGDRHLAARRFSQAKATFEGIVAREGPALARKRLLVARALEGQGRLPEALREAQVAREIAPRDAGALEGFARLAAAAGRHDEALEALEAAARLPSSRPGAFAARLAALRAARDGERARRLLGEGER